MNFFITFGIKGCCRTSPDAQSTRSSMSSGKNDLSVFGLEHLLNEAGIATDQIHSYGKDGMEAIKREFMESSIEAAKGSEGAKWEDQEDWKNFEYVTRKNRREAEEVMGNDGNKIELDVGRYRQLSQHSKSPWSRRITSSCNVNSYVWP